MDSSEKTDDIIIRLRRAYDETGNTLIGDALNEIARLRGAAIKPKPTLGDAVRTARGGDAPPPPMKGYA